MPLSPSVPVSAPVDEELAIRAAARGAEDDGDLVGALRLLRLLDDDAGVVRWRSSLEVGLRCRDDAERALWLLQPAFRHGFVSAARQALLTLAADVLRTRGRAAVVGSAETAQTAALDPLLVEAGLFELGMLEGYLTGVLRPAGHPQTGLLERWLRSRASVYEVCDDAPVRVLDAATDKPGTAMPVRNADGLRTGQLVSGRVLPLPEGFAFAVRPVEVDRLTARRIGRAFLRSAPAVERLRAVASHQRRRGGPS